MEEPTLNADAWSVKDLAVRCWNSLVADELEKIQAGAFEHFDWNAQENNTRFVSEGHGLNLATVRAELVASHDHEAAGDDGLEPSFAKG